MKSILGEFSSGVSVWRNKGTESNLGTLLAQPPLPGVRGALPQALVVAGAISSTAFAMKHVNSES